MKPIASSKQGFSLIELSIVLVILGLLTGGILAGQSLIRASELRSVTNDLQRYRSAIYGFRDKYFNLPGDITNATAFWGTATNCPGAFDQPSTTAATCNGNGNGLIEYFGVATAHEHFRIWQHLANAGLVEGSYSGVPATAANVRSFNTTNSPKAKISTAGYTFVSYGPRASTDLYWWEGNYNNQLSLTILNGAVGSTVLKPEEAWNVDTKIDDGKPALGNLRSMRKNSQPNCSSTDVESTAEYLLTYTSIACELVMIGIL